MSDFPVYLLRHGQTEWNAALRFQGQAETDINALGREQAAANGRRLRAMIEEPAGFDFVASPMRRTRQTMEIARREMGLDPTAYRTDERLREVHFGDWQGFTLAEVENRLPGSESARAADKWNFVPPGGESYAMLGERVRPWLDALARPTVCVTHGGVIRTLFVMRGGVSPAEAAAMVISQDRVFVLSDGRLREA